MLLKILRTATLSFLPICVLFALTPTAFTQNRRPPEIVLNWVAASNGQIPRGAFLGGSDKNRALYVCRAEYSNGLHPGKLLDKYCNIGWGGQEILSPNYEVLTAPQSVRLVWVAAANGRIPPGAFVGGYEKGQSLYLCRASYSNGWHPGKIVGRNCNFGWGGREVVRPNYEVLVLQDS